MVPNSVAIKANGRNTVNATWLSGNCHTYTYFHYSMSCKCICLTNSLCIQAIVTDVAQHFLQESTQVQEYIFAVLWQLHNNLKHRINKYQCEWYIILIMCKPCYSALLIYVLLHTYYNTSCEVVLIYFQLMPKTTGADMKIKINGIRTPQCTEWLFKQWHNILRVF
jgi:hypothetical protein